MRTVREMAAELGVSPAEVRERLATMGAPVESDSSPVTFDQMRDLRSGNGAVASGPGPRRTMPPPPPPAPLRHTAPSVPATAETAPPSVPATVETAAPSGADPPVAHAERAADPADAESLWARRQHPEEPSEAPPPPPDRGRVLSQIAELPLLVLLAFVIAVVIKTFLVQAFFIPSGSMYPTLHIGDRVLVEKLSYRFGDPQRQDVVVFAKSVFGRKPPDLPWYQDARNFLRELLGLPTGSEQDYIKRIVGLGGDTIRYAGKPRRLVVNGVGVDEPFVKGGRDRFSPTLTSGDCKRLGMPAVEGGCLVPQGKVFVMGDNRGNSEDSRAIGPIDEDKIVGHAFTIIWPPADFSGL